MRTCRASFQRTMSMRSPLSSSITFLMRLPRTPTHAPTASTFKSIDVTATFERYPASRATARMSMIRSSISGISSSKSARTKSGWQRDSTILTR